MGKAWVSEDVTLTDYLTEQEQIELLKNWIKQYSLVILAAVVIAFVSISGWRYWQHRQNKILVHASAIFDEMLTMRAQHNQAAATVHAKKLFSHYSKTTYGQMAALMLARYAAVKKNFPEAETYLNWVIHKSDLPSIRQIARIRLARIYIAENKPELAIKALDKIEEKSFIGLSDEIKGDAYLAMNNAKMARLAYQQALTELPNAEVIRPLLQMKFDNLAPMNS